MPKSSRWIQLNAAIASEIAGLGVADSPQRISRRNTESDSDLVATISVDSARRPLESK